MNNKIKDDRISKYCFNKITPIELFDLAKRLRDNIGYDTHSPVVMDDKLESDIRMAVNPMMCGDAGIMFMKNHKCALDFIIQLLNRLACEIDDHE